MPLLEITHYSFHNVRFWHKAACQLRLSSAPSECQLRSESKHIKYSLRCSGYSLAICSATTGIFRRSLYATPEAARSTLTLSCSSFGLAAMFHFDIKIPSGVEEIITHDRKTAQLYIDNSRLHISFLCSFNIHRCLA